MDAFVQDTSYGGLCVAISVEGPRQKVRRALREKRRPADESPGHRPPSSFVSIREVLVRTGSAHILESIHVHAP